MQKILFFVLVYYSLVAGQRWYISSLKLFKEYLRKNFFDTLQEFRYPNMPYEDFLGWPFGAAQLIDLNSIGFSNKSILVFDESVNSIFTRKHHYWIKRKVSNSTYGQIVTLKNFTDER